MYLQVFVYFKITPHNMRKHARSISLYADIWRDNDTSKTCFWKKTSLTWVCIHLFNVQMLHRIEFKYDTNLFLYTIWE